MQIKTEKNRKEIKEHGNYGFPVNISLESIQAYEQGMFWWHWHPEIELTCVLEGEIEYHINDSVYHLHAGDGLFGNSNTLHAGFQVADKECFYVSITFHPRFLYGYESSRLQTKYVNFITENERWHSLKLQEEVGWHREALSKMKEIYALSGQQPADYELQVHILLMRIWQELYRYFCALPKEEELPQKNIQRLREIIAYIQEHYNENISLDDIAGHINICKSECCRFFKKYMNMTIFEYLSFLRIQNSLSLLKRGESITRAAEMVGFSHPAYYGQIFRRYMKCTPREYKQQFYHYFS